MTGHSITDCLLCFRASGRLDGGETGFKGHGGQYRNEGKKESGIGLNILASFAADAGEARAPSAQNFEMKAMTRYSLGARLTGMNIGCRDFFFYPERMMGRIGLDPERNEGLPRSVSRHSASCLSGQEPVLTGFRAGLDLVSILPSGFSQRNCNRGPNWAHYWRVRAWPYPLP